MSEKLISSETDNSQLNNITFELFELLNSFPNTRETHVGIYNNFLLKFKELLKKLNVNSVENIIVQFDETKLHFIRLSFSIKIFEMDCKLTIGFDQFLKYSVNPIKVYKNGMNLGEVYIRNGKIDYLGLEDNLNYKELKKVKKQFNNFLINFIKELDNKFVIFRPIVYLSLVGYFKKYSKIMIP